MTVKMTFSLFWASEWVPLRLKRLHKDQASHGIALDAPHAHILKRKQIGRKWFTKNWDMGSIMAVKLTFWPFWASEWVPCVWKGCRKTRHHMASLWTPHMPIFWRKKNWPKTGPPNLGFGVRNGPKMVKNDPNAYNLHEVKLFDQLLPTFHWF